MFPLYGYNAAYLCDDLHPYSATAAANPADTVMFVSRSSYWQTGGWGTMWSTDGTWDTLSSLFAFAPHSNWTSTKAPGYDYNWGKGGFWDKQIARPEDGKYTGGDAIRATSNAIVAFTDGHAAKRPPGSLAVGATTAVGAPFIYDRTGANTTASADLPAIPPVDIAANYPWDLN